MFSKSFKTLPCRIIAVVLSAVLVLTFMPFLEGPTSAAAMKSGKSISQIKVGANQESESVITVSKPDSKGIVKINGNLEKFLSIFPGLVFYELRVDGNYVDTINNNKITDYKLDMKKFAVGYHLISVNYYWNGSILTNNGAQVADVVDYVPTKIYSKPANALKQFDVYHNHIRYYVNSTHADYDCTVQMSYKLSSQKWKKAKTRNMTDSYGWYKISGTKQGKKYNAKVRYVKKFTYKGKSYTWKGPYSKVRTVKTGKKIKVKSITVKAYKIKRRVVPVYGYYTGLRIGSRVVYTYKLKATVKLKKKPGAAGIMINKYRLKGNKKTYTKKLGSFSAGVNPKKLKYTISTVAYQNKTYGGWSQRVVKKKKII